MLDIQMGKLAVVQAPVAAERANPRPQTWVDGKLLEGVVTPANFDPASDTFDERYTGGNGSRTACR